MQSGKLRHVLMIQVAVENEGTISKAQTIIYNDVANVRAEIKPLSGRELVNAGGVDASATHQITIRYYSGLTSRHRFYQAITGRYFNILQPPRDIAERNRMMIVLCAEDV